MKIYEGKLQDVLYVEFEPKGDERGYFKRTLDVNIFKDHGIETHWVQENHSMSRNIGVLRGLHFQFPPYSEAKLVRCIKGKIFDVFLDLRSSSSTFGKWEGVELSSDNNRMVYIPKGFAHGFCTMEPDCEVLYKVDNFYAPNHEGGITWNDKELSVDWPVIDPQLSEKDKMNMSFAEFKQKHGALEWITR